MAGPADVTVAVSMLELPWQMAGLFTVTVILAFNVNVPEPDPVQPFALVTVTEYAPAVLTLMVEVVAPPGLHK